MKKFTLLSLVVLVLMTSILGCNAFRGAGKDLSDTANQSGHRHQVTGLQTGQGRVACDEGRCALQCGARLRAGKKEGFRGDRS